MTTEDKISALLDGALGWTREEFVALALAAIDQGGTSLKDQQRIAGILGVCVDCKLEPSTATRRCDLCESLHDAFLRDMETDRRIDEARGK